MMGGGWSILDMGGDRCSGGEMALLALDGGVSPPSPPILGNPGKKILLGKLLHGMKNDHVKIYCCPKSMTIYRN